MMKIIIDNFIGERFCFALRSYALLLCCGVVTAAALVLGSCAEQTVKNDRQITALTSQLLEIDSVVVMDPNIILTVQGWRGKRRPSPETKLDWQEIIAADATRALFAAGYDVIDFDFTEAIANNPAFASNMEELKAGLELAASEADLGLSLTAMERSYLNESMALAAKSIAAEAGVDAVLFIRYVGFRKNKHVARSEKALSAISFLLTIPFGVFPFIPGKDADGRLEAAFIDGQSGSVIWFDERSGIPEKVSAPDLLGTLPRDIDPQQALGNVGNSIDGALVNMDSPRRALKREIDYYADIFSAQSLEPKLQALSSLAWSGISDKRVYQPMIDELLAGLNTQNMMRAQQMAQFAQALAYSGQARYQEVLQIVVDSAARPELREAALDAQAALFNHASWNAVILAGIDEPKAIGLDELRIGNMLNADDQALVSAGAQWLSREHLTNQRLLDIAYMRLLYHIGDGDPPPIWAAALDDLMMVLVKSENTHYAVALEAIAKTAADPELASKAKRYADQLLGKGAPRPKCRYEAGIADPDSC